MLYRSRLLPLATAIGLASFAACDADDTPIVAPVPEVVVPSTYDFDNVSYAGQQERHAMLAEMKTYMNSAKTAPGVDGDRLRAMYANEAGADFSRDYGKDLRSKTLPAVQADFDRYLARYAELTKEDLARATPGSGGPVTTADGEKTYVVDDNGVEWVQIIEKGLMGATFYYQATSVVHGRGPDERRQRDRRPRRGHRHGAPLGRGLRLLRGPP